MTKGGKFNKKRQSDGAALTTASPPLTGSKEASYFTNKHHTAAVI